MIKQNSIVKHKHKGIVNFFVYSLPLILLLEWFNEFKILEGNYASYLRGLSIIVFSLFLIFKPYKIKDFDFKKILISFLLLNLVYSIFSLDILYNLYYFFKIAYWILGTLTFYYLFSYNYLSIKKFRMMIVLIALIGSVFTIIFLDRLSLEGLYDNGNAYLLMWCLPILLLFKRNKIVTYSFLIAIVAILFTIKRGAILATISGLLVYFFMLIKMSKKSKSNFKYLFSGIIIFSLVAIVLVSKWDILGERLKDTSGSGRETLYPRLIKHYIESPLENLVFGFGINSVQIFTNPNKLYYSDNKYKGVKAHSDWLQTIHDFGFFGFLFMLLLHIKFISMIRYNSKIRSDLLPTLLFTYVIFTLTTIYSFIFSAPNGIFFGIVISVLNIKTNYIKYQILYELPRN